MNTSQSILIADIRDGGAQMRVEMKSDVVLEYADEMAVGATFPPVVVYHDGSIFWLADGFHRVAAARKLERETIEAEVREGGERDAILHGIGSNASHGLRRTQADKRQAVERLIRDEEWGKWSNRKIAKAARVDHKTVATYRTELLGGEFPAPAKSNGGFPTSHGMTVTRSAVEDLLRSISIEQLTGTSIQPENSSPAGRTAIPA